MKSTYVAFTIQCASAVLYFYFISSLKKFKAMSASVPNICVACDEDIRKKSGKTRKKELKKSETISDTINNEDLDDNNVDITNQLQDNEHSLAE